MDHPHACGDKNCRLNNLCGGIGSSPRVWGQAASQNYKDHVPRIIPTRVGTRLCVISVLQANEDHPHACGDKKNTTRTLDTARGSSPRVWGQVDRRADTHLITGSSPRVWGQEIIDSIFNFCTGIIPTRVGTRPSFAFLSSL